MRRLIVFLLFLIISVWFGVQVVRHPGYLLLVYQPWMVQMPLWFAILGLLLVFLLFYFFLDVIDQCQFTWFRFKNWLRFRHEHQLYSKTQQGLSALIEWRWPQAERLLLAGANQSLEPLINYLGAARAAQEQKAFERRDSYIQKAYQIAPRAELAIGLTQAELELKQGQLQHAAATLQHLRQSTPRHPRVLTLLQKVYVRTGDWQNLILLLPSLRKAKVFNNEEYLQFEKNIYVEIFKSASSKNLDDLHQAWKEVPAEARKMPEVVAAYVKQLLRFPDTTEAEELIRKTLKYAYHAELVKLYGTLPFANLNRQLVVVGAWHKLYGPRPAVLLTLGRLCVRVQLWGKAKDYFEKSIMQSPDPEAILEYGRLLEQLGEKDEALQKYRDGLVRLASKPEVELAIT